LYEVLYAVLVWLESLLSSALPVALTKGCCAKMLPVTHSIKKQKETAV
jgi:hypothetical protein